MVGGTLSALNVVLTSAGLERVAKNKEPDKGNEVPIRMCAGKRVSVRDCRNGVDMDMGRTTRREQLIEVEQRASHNSRRETKEEKARRALRKREKCERRERRERKLRRKKRAAEGGGFSVIAV